MARHGLTDEQWALIEDLFPPNGKHAGRPWSDHRRMIDGMLWILVTGAPWRDLAKEFGPWQTVYDRFSLYRMNGMIDRVLDRLKLKRNEQGKIGCELFCIDGTNVRAARAAAGAKKGGLRRRHRMSPKTTPWGVPAGASAQRST
jgi:transposase